MNSRYRVSIIFLSILACSFALISKTEARKPNQNQSGPTLLKRTINVNVRRFGRYWKNPKAAEPVYNTYCWTPTISFEVLGPVQGGSQFYVEFDTPDGKPWVKFDMFTPELEADYLDTIKMPNLSESEIEKKAILQTGVFPFRIKLKNALEGKDEVLFAGKYKVSTYTPDQRIPDYKGKQEFYVDQDWRLPIGYLWLNPVDNENAPPLSVQMWFRGASDFSQMQAYVFHNGKQFKMLTVAGNPISTLTSAADDPNYRWTLWQFTATNVRGFNNDSSTNTYPDTLFLDKNPGEYEIKVIRENQLARVAKFTVGPDGKIVDNGLARNAKLGGIRLILPVKIVGAMDGKFNVMAWQSEAFYANPLAGFVAP